MSDRRCVLPIEDQHQHSELIECIHCEAPQHSHLLFETLDIFLHIPDEYLDHHLLLFLCTVLLRLCDCPIFAQRHVTSYGCLVSKDFIR